MFEVSLLMTYCECACPRIVYQYIDRVPDEALHEPLETSLMSSRNLSFSCLITLRLLASSICSICRVIRLRKGSSMKMEKTIYEGVYYFIS
jgi:hypothetical protein